jgi:catechol 2,3-dioxygenase-like lactoylglutathione lyase family enzyme
MKIEHLALWTVDLERMIAFYTTYFGGPGPAGATRAPPARSVPAF